MQALVQLRCLAALSSRHVGLLCLAVSLLLVGCRSGGKLSSLPGMARLSPGAKDAAAAEPHDPTINYPPPSAAELPRTLSSSEPAPTRGPMPRAVATSAPYPSTGLGTPSESLQARPAQPSTVATGNTAAMGPAAGGHLAADGHRAPAGNDIIPPQFGGTPTNGHAHSALGLPQQGLYQAPGPDAPSHPAVPQQASFLPPAGPATPSPLQGLDNRIPAPTGAWSPASDAATGSVGPFEGSAAVPIPSHDEGTVAHTGLTQESTFQPPAQQDWSAGSAVEATIPIASAAGQPAVSAGASRSVPSAYAPQRSASTWLPGSTSQLPQRK